jgi:predicted DNA-binding transcriptional regulator AlpA
MARQQKSRPTDPAVTAKTKGRFLSETAGQKQLKSDSDGVPHIPRGPPPRLAYSIPEFCAAVGISQAYFFELKRDGKGPKEIALGTRRLISVDEARRWCAERTTASNPKEAA